MTVRGSRRYASLTGNSILSTLVVIMKNIVATEAKITVAKEVKITEVKIF